MPIEIRCECGARYRVPDNCRGRMVRCKHCQALVPVPKEEVVEVAVDVVEEEPAAALDEEVEERPRTKKAKDKKKKKRRDKDWAPTLEERLARRESGSWRKNEIRRGWKYVIGGLGLIGVGVMLSVCLYLIAAGDPTHATTDYGVASLALRTVGAWGPAIGLGIAGLVPIGLGVMNFLGIGIVVEDPDD